MDGDEGQGSEFQSDPTPVGNADPSGSVSEADQFVNDFLKNVAPEHRSFVEPYYKDWGSRVTQGFQKVHEQYKPYKELGYQPDEIRQMASQLQFIAENPAQAYQRLHTYLQQNNMLPQMQPQQQMQQPQHPLIEKYGDSIPTEVLQRIAEQEKALETVTQHLVQQRQAEQLRQGQEALQSTLSQLKSKADQDRVPFNENFVSWLIGQGVPAEAAYGKWHEIVKSAQVQQAQHNVPPIMTSSNVAPAAPLPKFSELKQQQRRQLVADFMKLQNPSG